MLFRSVILQRRCLRASIDIKKNTIIKKDMLAVLRPAPHGSISPKFINKVVNKTAQKNIKKGEALKMSML